MDQELLEQCAQVCWEAQRALAWAEGKATPANPAPVHWLMAHPSERDAAVKRVRELWESCTFPPHNPARFEDALALHIVAAFKFHRRRPGKEGGGRGQVLEDV